MSRKLLKLVFIFLLAVLGGAVSAAATSLNESQGQKDYWSDGQIRVSDNAILTSSTGLDFLLSKRNDGWHLSPLLENQSIAEDDEVVTIAMDGLVSLKFSKACRPAETGIATECSCTKGLLGHTRAKNGYSLCTSAFRTSAISAVGVARTVFVTALGGFAFGSTTVEFKVDTEALGGALREAGITAKANERIYAVYQREAATAFGLSALAAFVEKYERWSYDPDSLIPQMKAQHAVMAANAKAKEEERQSKARERENQRLQQLAREAEYRAQVLKSYRINLKEGDDTFCGPVIERKAQMVRIALRVQLSGYASDQWLKVDEVFMPSQGCINRNGNLSPQTY